MLKAIHGLLCRRARAREREIGREEDGCFSPHIRRLPTHTLIVKRSAESGEIILKLGNRSARCRSEMRDGYTAHFGQFGEKR